MADLRSADPGALKTRGSRSLKLLDRYAGVPLIALLAMRRRRKVPQSIRRIGLMKTAAIGDTALLAGLVDDVKTAYPAASVTMITGPDNAGVVPLLGSAVDNAITVAPNAFPESVAKLRALGLDVLIDLGAWPRFDAVLAALSRARFTIGFETAAQFRHYAYDAVVQHSNAMHERANYGRLLATLGVVPCAAARIAAPNVLRSDRIPREPFAVFHPWSSGYLHEAKEWPLERWVALAARLSAQVGSIVITGGRGETQRASEMTRRMTKAGIPAVDMSGTLSLAELTDLLAASVFVVSVNTGVAHLAGLVGALTISLEGPTPPVRWAPLGPRVRTVVTALPGCGYLDLGFEYGGQRLDCMTGISVEAVAAVIQDALVSEASSGARLQSPRIESGQ